MIDEAHGHLGILEKVSALGGAGFSIENVPNYEKSKNTKNS